MNNNFLGLSERNLQVLSWAVFSFTLCLGVKTVITPNLALKVANTQLVTSNSASKLENLAKQLQEQAELIEQKDAKYQQLEATYQEYLKNEKGDIDLGIAIEAIDDLPKPDKLEQIQVEISETESDLLELTE